MGSLESWDLAMSRALARALAAQAQGRDDDALQAWEDLDWLRRCAERRATDYALITRVMGVVP